MQKLQNFKIFQKIMNFVRWLLLKIASLRKCWRKHKCFSVKIFEYDWSTYLSSIIVIELMYDKILVWGVNLTPSLSKTLNIPVLLGLKISLQNKMLLYNAFVQCFCSMLLFNAFVQCFCSQHTCGCRLDELFVFQFADTLHFSLPFCEGLCYFNVLVNVFLVFYPMWDFVVRHTSVQLMHMIFQRQFRLEIRIFLKDVAKLVYNCLNCPHVCLQTYTVAREEHWKL